MKRFSKIFAVALVITMLASVFCFPSSAVIADSSIDVKVKLEKVTTPGEIACDDTGLDATELGNIYKVTVGFTATNAGLSRFQAAVVYDDELFDVCYGSGTGAENFISYPVGDGSDFGFTAACKYLGTAGLNDAYASDGTGGQTSSLKIKAYGLSHASAGTTFVAEKLDYNAEAYSNCVAWAYPGETAPANRGAFITSYTCSTSCAKSLILPTGEEEFVSIYLILKDGKTDTDVNGTELRVSLIDYSGVALTNLTQYGSMYGMAKTAQQDTVASCTANGLSYTYTAPSPVYAKGSQIRFHNSEVDETKAWFDVRTRAALTTDDFNEICVSEDNAKALAAAGKLQVGFVYKANIGDPATIDLATAKAVATGATAAGYTNVPVTYIQSTGTEYIWTCLIRDADYNGSVQALGYIIVDGTPYYFEAASLTTFSTLYDTWYDDYAATLS